MMFVKTSKELGYCGGRMALTLSPSELGVNDSGWKIEGEVHEDYYEWVNEFEAFHLDFGRVWGDFQGEVYADSEVGFEDFFKNHPPEEWDIQDI
jgi:hypothetical protein